MSSRPAYAVGNEIPAQIVRWHGRRRVELEKRHELAAESRPPSTAHAHFLSKLSTMSCSARPGRQWFSSPICGLPRTRVYGNSDNIRYPN